VNRAGQRGKRGSSKWKENGDRPRCCATASLKLKDCSAAARFFKTS
jgi:hypothetical protein